MESRQSIIITVHGIRTYGAWSSRLSAMLEKLPRNHSIVSYAYGYFSSIAFAVPLLRWIEVRRFRKHLLRQVVRCADADLCIISHSFGTYVVAQALRSIPHERRPAISRLILCGSVLKSTFDYEDLLQGGVKSIVNDCCTDDSILLLSQAFIIGTGMAGRVGFYGMNDARMVNRFHLGGHSGYFDDKFMCKWWLDILDDPSKPPPHSDRVTTPSVVDGVKHVLTGNLDPVKIPAYLALIGWPVYMSANAIYLISEVNKDFIAEGEERALARIVKSQFPREKITGSPLDHIIIKSGNYSVSYTDALVDGTNYALVHRTYNSRSTIKGVFGKGWGSSFETKIVKKKDAISLHFELNGEPIQFKQSGPNRFLVGGYVLQENSSGFVLDAQDGRRYIFDRGGRLIEDSRPGAKSLKLSWTKGKLVEVIGVAKLVYDSSGELSAINFADGKRATYAIVNGLLMDASNVIGKHYQYNYDKTWHLTSIKYEDGTERTIGYDRYGLVNYARYPNGYEVKISYGDMLESQEGKWTESLIAVEVNHNTKNILRKKFSLYETSPEGRLFKTVEVIDGARIETNYDPASQAPVQIRAMGKIVSFEYDEFGRLVKQRGRDSVGIRYDSSGRIVAWERSDQAWNLLSKISFQYTLKGELEGIDNNGEFFKLKRVPEGLHITSSSHQLHVVGEKITYDGVPVNTAEQIRRATDFAAKMLRATARPTELFEMYRPCGCNAFPESILSSEDKERLESVLNKLGGRI